MHATTFLPPNIDSAQALFGEHSPVDKASLELVDWTFLAVLSARQLGVDDHIHDTVLSQAVDVKDALSLHLHKQTLHNQTS